jgi:DNA invertase Pin-like site-specific DNA recombinase
MGWRVVAEFENRESGAKSEKDRPQFKVMMNAASRREFDMVLVWSLDRFSREGIAKTFDHLRRLGSYGVKFRSYSESFLDTTAEFGELVAAIFAFFASFERRRIAERIGAGLERARAQGTTLWETEGSSKPHEGLGPARRRQEHTGDFRGAETIARDRAADTSSAIV